jgi:hypothetical protein
MIVGIDHIELEFLDGSNPPDFILAKFIDKCELTPGAAAVHCKAGLGRTGSCIGAYMMKHFRFTAEEAIGWMRIVRPGMVIGPQQQWMRDMQTRMWQEGEIFYAKLTNAVNNLPLPALSGTGSSRSTPRSSVGSIPKSQQQFQSQYSDLPAMEEKSSAGQRSGSTDNGNDTSTDGKAQGDLLRIRREQQHKNHFPIEPSLTSVSMKVSSHAPSTLRTTGSTSSAKTATNTMTNGSRPTTPGNAKLFHNGATEHTSASGRILRTPTNKASSPIQVSTAVTINTNAAKADGSGTTPPSSGKSSSFSAFFGSWRS